MARPKKSSSSSKAKKVSRKPGFGGDGESLPKAKPKESPVSVVKPSEPVVSAPSAPSAPSPVVFELSEGSEAHHFANNLLAALGERGVSPSQVVEAMFHRLYLDSRRLPRDTITHRLLRAVSRIKEGLPL